MKTPYKSLAILALLAVALLTMAPSQPGHESRGLTFSDVPFEAQVIRSRLEGDPDRPIIVGVARIIPGDNATFLNGQGLLQFRASVDQESLSVEGRGRFRYSGEIEDGTDILMEEGLGVARFTGIATPPTLESPRWVLDLILTGKVWEEVTDSDFVPHGWDLE